jgi:outer membrane protein OmpA-like peptidoglycan-associated protein
MADALFLGGRQYGAGQYNEHPVPFLYSDLLEYANSLGIDTCSDFTAVYRLYASPTSDSTTVSTAYEATSTVTVAGDPTQDGCEPDILLPPTGAEAEDLSLLLKMDVGVKLEGALTLLEGKGLQAASKYQLIIESTPHVLYTGKTNADGNFSTSVKIPAFCPGSGKHTLTLIGTKPNGKRTKAVTYLVLDKKCTALAIVQGKKSNKSVKVGGLSFDYGSAKLKSETIAALDLIAPAIKSAKSVTIVGFTQTDKKSKASRAANLKLGGKRAQNVANYLASHGVKAKFVVVAKGAVNPASPRIQAKNRRVEISVRFIRATLNG